MAVEAKICGLKDAASLEAAAEGGAAMVGFVFFPPSPRSIEPAEQAKLAAFVPKDIPKVGLVVDADDGLLDRLVGEARLDMLQLHGLENPERVQAIRARYGLPVIKAVAISGFKDIVLGRDYEAVADRLLFDARPPKGATRPGGNAVAFDWMLLKDQPWHKPWLLAGGIHEGNVAEAVAASGARMVDVSSGVEDRPGVKNPEKIRRFLALARSLG
jgi:phosphoribosylanthranilate isomerase